MSFKAVLFVFLGGGAGSVVRFLIGKWLNTGSNLPWGTFLANVLGSFIIGLTLGWASKNNMMHQQITWLIAAGFCGGFTTFSTFAFETHQFLKQGELLQFALYAALSLILGILAIVFGLYINR
jgi:CrcB protein